MDYNIQQQPTQNVPPTAFPPVEQKPSRGWIKWVLFIIITLLVIGILIALGVLNKGRDFFDNPSTYTETRPTYKCSNDSDCILVKNGYCGTVISINRNYQGAWVIEDKINTKIAKYNKQTCKVSSTESHNINNFTALCINRMSKCAARITSPMPSANESTNFSCSNVNRNPPELTFEASYCNGDLCTYAKNKEECESRDVISVRNNLPVPGTDGEVDCRWVYNLKACVPNSHY